MAFRRCLSTIDILNLRGLRLRPSYRHIFDDESVDSHPQPQIASPSHFFHAAAAAYSSTGCNAASSRFQARSFAAAPFGFGFPHSSPSLRRWISSSSAAEHSLASEIVDEVSQTTLDVASQIPDLSEVAIAAANSAYPVAALQHLIDNVHSFTGLNWWAAIALTTVLLQLAKLPWLISIRNCKPLDSQLLKELNRIIFDPDVTELTKISRMTLLLKGYGLDPKMIFVEGTVDVTISLSYIFAMINMAERVPSFQTGGALWFVDLTTEAYVLPFLSAFAGWTWQKVMNRPTKLLNIIATTRFVVPVMLGFPQAMYIHWITSKICFYCFQLALGEKPAIKKLSDSPEVPDAPPSSTEKKSKKSDSKGTT